MEFVVTWRELLIAVVLATAVYLFEVLLFSRRRRPGRAAPAGRPGTEAGGELARLGEELAGLRRRVEVLEGQLSRDAMPGPMEEDSAYGRAVRMAREGLPAQDVATRCGISRGEAELIIALNRGDQ